MVSFFRFICHGVVGGLMRVIDSGLLREFFLGLIHLIPLYSFILNLNFFT
jgi:hypothetical protein